MSAISATAANTAGSNGTRILRDTLLPAGESAQLTNPAEAALIDNFNAFLAKKMAEAVKELLPKSVPTALTKHHVDQEKLKAQNESLRNQITILKQKQARERALIDKLKASNAKLKEANGKNAEVIKAQEEEGKGLDKRIKEEENSSSSSCSSDAGAWTPGDSGSAADW